MNNFNMLPINLYSPDLYEYIENIATENGCECYTDRADNIIIHKNGVGEKVLIPFVANREELLITSVNSDEASFATNKDIKNSTEVFMSNKSVGLVADKKIKLYNNSNVKKGDFLHLCASLNCKGYKLYGNNLKANLSLYLFVNLINQKIYTDKEIYFTLSFSNRAAKSIPKSIVADYIFTIFYDDTNDNFEISKGCGIVYKDNGVIIKKDIIDFYLKCAKDTNYQKYFGKSKSLTEYYLISSIEAKIGSLIIPIKNIDTSCEIGSIKDITSAIIIYKNLFTNEV